MRYLLDTHVVIWAMVGSRRLSDSARLILQDPDNVFYVSSASIWEVSIKHSVRPSEIPVTSEQMIRFCRNSGIVELPVSFGHAQRVSALPLHHNDPFDRMLVAQAIEESLLLVSHDQRLPPYGSFVISV